MALPQRQMFSVEEYFALDSTSTERYEYLNGDVYLLAGGSPAHAIITLNLGSIVKNALRGRSCLAYSPDVYFYLSASHYVHPDVSVSCNEQDHKDPESIKHPCLIIEVLSPTTEAIDRGKKFGWYRACPSIQEYVLVASEYQEVQVYQREQNNLWTLRNFGPGDIVKLARLGISFTMADVYEGVVFPEEA